MVLIDDTVAVLKYSFMVESLLEILTKTGNQALYKLIDVLSVANVPGNSISSISMWNIVNQ